VNFAGVGEIQYAHRRESQIAKGVAVKLDAQATIKAAR